MNQAEAKSILQLYRPDTADVADPQIAEALELAKQDPELAAWLTTHSDRQRAWREKFRQIPVPAGLKEQIISEQAAHQRSSPRQRRMVALATALCVVALILWIPWHRGRPAEDTLEVYQHTMIGLALRGYGMDLNTNDLPQIRTYLAQHQAPADFQLSPVLKNTTVIGCAVETWQAAKVSLICFQTPKAPGQNSLWLFVVDQTAFKKINATAAPQLNTIHRLITATWVQNGKIYFLGSQGDKNEIESYL